MAATKDFVAGFISGFQEFSKAVAHTINLLMLTLTYFLGIGIVAIFARIGKKSFLQIGKRQSYWIDKNLSKQSYEEYKRTF